MLQVLTSSDTNSSATSCLAQLASEQRGKEMSHALGASVKYVLNGITHPWQPPVQETGTFLRAGTGISRYHSCRLHRKAGLRLCMRQPEEWQERSLHVLHPTGLQPETKRQVERQKDTFPFFRVCLKVSSLFSKQNRANPSIRESEQRQQSQIKHFPLSIFGG